jgi:hypothetical protein
MVLAAWAKRLAWQQVADLFHAGWQNVYRSVQILRQIRERFQGSKQIPGSVSTAFSA